MPSFVLPSDTVRIADEERSHLMLDAKVNHPPGRLVPQAAHASLGPPTDLAPGVLEFLPAAGMLLAAALFFGKLAELPVALPLERADATPGDDQGRARVRRDGSQMDLTEVDRRLYRARGLFRSRDFHADMQFKAVVPDERAGASICRKVKRQDEGRSPLAHWQDHTPALHAHRLGRPVDGVKPLLAPGILHAHLGMLPAQFAGRLNRAQEGAEDRLHRLAMQGKAPLRGLVQIILVRPRDMPHSGLLVDVHAYVPDLRGCHLRRLKAAQERRREVSQAIHAYCFHTFLFFLSARNAVIGRMGSKTSGVASIPPPRTGRVFPLPLIKLLICGNQKFCLLLHLSPVSEDNSSIEHTAFRKRLVERFMEMSQGEFLQARMSQPIDRSQAILDEAGSVAGQLAT